MAKLTRKNLKVFAQNSSESGQFGSARMGTKVLSDDPDVIQGLPAWEQGWNDATSAGQEPPTLEEFQGVQYVHSYQTAYILQEGIPEYSDTTEYYLNSLAKEGGTVKIYKSLADNNLGNPLSDTNNWRFVFDFNTVQPQNNYTATVDPTVNDDVTLGYSAGSYWYNTVSEETFFCVNADTGAAVWVLQSSNAMPIGVPFPLRTDLGVSPPSNSGTAKFIELTYGKSGAGGYNEGLLTDEVLTGTFPDNLVATAKIIGGIMNGQTIRLLNTMRLFTRGAESGGALQRDAIRNFTGNFVIISQQDTQSGGITRIDPVGSNNLSFPGVGSQLRGRTVIIDASNQVPTAPENRVQNEGVTFFMRII